MNETGALGEGRKPYDYMKDIGSLMGEWKRGRWTEELWVHWQNSRRKQVAYVVPSPERGA